jgi:Sulfotransferase family
MDTITFICGCGHSGTTLLANMFAAHPLVHVPLVETNAFLIPDAIAIRWPAVLEEAEKSGKPHLVEKTPRHIRCLATIRQHVPSAKIVMMVRDGRDVAASLMRRFDDLGAGVQRWLEDSRFVAREIGSPDTFLLRYEDLVSNPARELDRCCAFVGIPFYPEMLRYHETVQLWFGETEIRLGSGREGKEHHALRNWQVNQPIFDGRGSWRQRLSSEQVKELPRQEMEQLFAKFGYAWESGE